MNKPYLVIIGLTFLFVGCSTNKKVTTTKQNDYLQDKYAGILKVQPSEIKNIALYTFIDEWMGVKYQYGGMTKQGVDCSGFCNQLYKEIYNKEIKRTTKELSKATNKVGKERLKEGDLVFFNISNKKDAHVGVYLTNNHFVHASTSKGVVISSLENPYYKKNYHKGGRL